MRVAIHNRSKGSLFITRNEGRFIIRGFYLDSCEGRYSRVAIHNRSRGAFHNRNRGSQFII